MSTIGYARVSTQDQDLSAQLAALKAAGCATVYREKVSGVRADRPQLQKLLARISPGDTVLVARLDRLARSTRDLLNTLAFISDRRASFRSLGDPWADTTTPHGKLMVTILGGLAEFERSLIVRRTSEGRERAMERGVKFGRPHALNGFQQQEALKRRRDGEPLSLIAQSYRVSAKTISRL